MNKKKWFKYFFLTIITLLWLLLVSCWDKGELISETIIVELGQAQKVDVTIALYQGNIFLQGENQSSLLLSHLEYNLQYWLPQIDYQVENEIGKLKIFQEKEKNIFRPLINNWSFLFNMMVPLSLDVIMGSGENHLDFSSINLAGLKAVLGTGDTILDLTGDYPDNINIYLFGGIGHTTINLSQDRGVGIWISGALNKINCNGFSHINNFYYNKAFYNAEKKIYLTIISGIGLIDIKLI